MLDHDDKRDYGRWNFTAACDYLALSGDLLRLALALALGLLIGLERERRAKEAGLRTFGFVALLGALGGALGEGYGLAALVLTGVLTVFLNIYALRADQGLELTCADGIPYNAPRARGHETIGNAAVGRFRADNAVERSLSGD